MKFLFMALLLANLGFFAWQQWYDPTHVDLPQGRPDSDLGAGLQLVGEDTRANSPASVAAPDQRAVTESTESEDDAPGVEASVSAAPEGSCASLGPFEQLETAQVASDRLEEFGSPAVVREAGGQIRAGFWVYLPPYSSRDEAKRVEDELRGRNVRDLFIVTASDQRNAISLGLFSTPDRADQRAAEIGRLGYTPRVAERFRDATVYWVDFREQAGEPLDPQRVGVVGVGEVLPEKRNIACSDIAVAAPDA